MLTNITPTTFKARIIIVKSKPTRDKIDFMPLVSTASIPTMFSSGFLISIFDQILKRLPLKVKKPS